jgi:hypothetical protein
LGERDVLLKTPGLKKEIWGTRIVVELSAVDELGSQGVKNLLGLCQRYATHVRIREAELALDLRGDALSRRGLLKTPHAG